MCWRWTRRRAREAWRSSDDGSHRRASSRGDAARSHAERLPGELARLLGAHGLSVGDIDLFAVGVRARIVHRTADRHRDDAGARAGDRTADRRRVGARGAGAVASRPRAPATLVAAGWTRRAARCSPRCTASPSAPLFARSGSSKWKAPSGRRSGGDARAVAGHIRQPA